MQIVSIEQQSYSYRLCCWPTTPSILNMVISNCGMTSTSILRVQQTSLPPFLSLSLWTHGLHSILRILNPITGVYTRVNNGQTRFFMAVAFGIKKNESMMSPFIRRREKNLFESSLSAAHCAKEELFPRVRRVSYKILRPSASSIYFIT